MVWRRIGLLVPVLAAAPLACSPGTTPPSRTPHARPAAAPVRAPDDGTCHELRDPLSPSLVAWDADDRALVKVLARHGAVAVRYFVNGCEASLEVLPGCTSDARYGFSARPDKHHELIWKANVLQSRFSLGAATLRGEFASQRVLAIDVQQAGVAALSAPAPFPAQRLHGPDCARATHVIQRVAFGSFALASGGAGALRDLATSTPSDTDDPAAQLAYIAAEGGPSTCVPARDVDGSMPICAAALGVTLVPLAGAAQNGAACPPSSRWVGTACVQRAGMVCAAGSHFLAARGCVRDSTTPPSLPELEAWYVAHQKDDTTVRRLAETAYQLAEARLLSGAGSAAVWYQRTLDAFARVPQGQADVTLTSMAAEAAFRLLDARITDGFDYATGHHHYSGQIISIIHQYESDAADARTFGEGLQHIVDAYQIPEWTVAALVRSASLYDSLRSGLVHTREPAVDFFDEHTLQLLAMAEQSDNAALVHKAHVVRAKVRAAWRRRVALELDSATFIAVDRYAAALALARRYHIWNATVARSLERLALLEAVAGPAKMAKYMQRVPDLGYTPGMFTAMQSENTEHR